MYSCDSSNLSYPNYSQHETFAKLNLVQKNDIAIS